jgi:hypothetical protein
MRRMPCRRYKQQDSAHELAMSPLNLSKILSMAVNPLASHPDQVVLTSRAKAGLDFAPAFLTCVTKAAQRHA